MNTIDKLAEKVENADPRELDSMVRSAILGIYSMTNNLLIISSMMEYHEEYAQVITEDKYDEDDFRLMAYSVLKAADNAIERLKN